MLLYCLVFLLWICSWDLCCFASAKKEPCSSIERFWRPERRLKQTKHKTPFQIATSLCRPALEALDGRCTQLSFPSADITSQQHQTRLSRRRASTTFPLSQNQGSEKGEDSSEGGEIRKYELGREGDDSMEQEALIIQFCVCGLQKERKNLLFMYDQPRFR